MRKGKNFSGRYPHLAVTNGGNTECGIGALAPWNGKLWYITYPASAALGSDDKLYSLDEDLNRESYPGSVGGTHANRMIHRESGQLNIGLYFIDRENKVRVISPKSIVGRCTASARHLTDPRKIYIFTMEEGLYEVDVDSLDVKVLLADKYHSHQEFLPGRHGKGGYTGQGYLLYTNNGQGGVLAAWDGKGDPNNKKNWTIIDENKYTEVTGPGGIYGPDDPKAPIWALGWDQKSVLLQVCEAGKWYRFRLPKASFAYDAEHGWYTEWPRIRDVGQEKLLMDMHGMFYQFPALFCSSNPEGITPLARHQKMVVDFAQWQDQLVIAANDATVMQNPYLGRSQSNLWFVDFQDLKKMGQPAGWGGVWHQESVKGGVPSEPFLIAGFESRVLHLSHDYDDEVKFDLEVYREGSWEQEATVCVGARGYNYLLFPEAGNASWARITSAQDLEAATAYFHLSSGATVKDPDAFNSLAPVGRGQAYARGLLYPQDDEALTLSFKAEYLDARGVVVDSGYYEIGEEMILQKKLNPLLEKEIAQKLAIKKEYEIDAASVIISDGEGTRYRLPKGSTNFDQGYESIRCIREVVTERFLMNAHGTFFELPRDDSGGIAKIKPISTHNLLIHDFASWRGMLVLAGTLKGAMADGHYLGSDDGEVGLWFGDVDDIWRMGAPQGEGGPCYNTFLAAGQASDPYLMTGYEEKQVSLSHDQDQAVEFTIEIDFTADLSWNLYKTIMVKPGQKVTHHFPKGFHAHWVRVRANRDCRATAWFVYSP